MAIGLARRPSWTNIATTMACAVPPRTLCVTPLATRISISTFVPVQFLLVPRAREGGSFVSSCHGPGQRWISERLQRLLVFLKLNAEAATDFGPVGGLSLLAAIIFLFTKA